jgi:hypothetical protein
LEACWFIAWYCCCMDADYCRASLNKSNSVPFEWSHKVWPNNALQAESMNRVSLEVFSLGCVSMIECVHGGCCTLAPISPHFFILVWQDQVLLCPGIFLPNGLWQAYRYANMDWCELVQTADCRRKTCTPSTAIGTDCSSLGIEGTAGSKAWGILWQLCEAY